MGRKYATVMLRYNGNIIEGMNALFDSGADISIIGTEIANELKIDSPNILIKWTASDGMDEESPIIELEIRTNDDKEFVQLPAVMIDDRPIDFDLGEDMILGLDYLQIVKKTLCFDE